MKETRREQAHLPAQQPEAGEAARIPAPDGDPGGTGGAASPPPAGPRPAVGLTWRIRDRGTFVELRRRGRRARRGPVTVTWMPGPASQPPRVAYAVGRPVGGAVVRNRLRRRLRGIVAELAESLRPGAWMIGAGPGAVDMNYEDLKASVAEALSAIPNEPAR